MSESHAGFPFYAIGMPNYLLIYIILLKDTENCGCNVTKCEKLNGFEYFSRAQQMTALPYLIAPVQLLCVSH